MGVVCVCGWCVCLCGVCVFVWCVCVCSFRYPKFKEFTPCNTVTSGLPVCLHNTFPHYLIKDTIFGKTSIEHKMCVSIFSTTFVSSTELHITITVRRSSYTVPVFF